MFQRFFDDGLAQSSYLIGCERTRKAVVIDARRDVDAYVQAAARHGLAIQFAIETHIHADFVSGARELGAVGARTLAGPGAALAFEHHEVADGEMMELGDLHLRFLHTPGHTPEHISILLDQPGSATRAFTGDTLFVGAVGRPDLLGEELTRRLAADLHDSLFHKLLELGDDVEVHPGHGAGSLCGAGIGSDPHSTIGQERRFNPMLQHASRDGFVAAVLGDLPETPPYFPRMKQINRAGPDLLGLAAGFRGASPLTAEQAAAAGENGAWLIDLRGADAFSAGHPRGAVNIGMGSKVGYWAGWVVPADAQVVLLAAADVDIDAVTRQLLRVGLDRIVGYVRGGFEAWRAAGLPAAAVPQMSVRQLHERVTAHAPLTVLDVRTPGEWRSGHIDGATHVPVGHVGTRAHDLPQGPPIATFCEGGYRSSLAASLLLRAGVENVVNVTGGMSAYRALEGTS